MYEMEVRVAGFINGGVMYIYTCATLQDIHNGITHTSCL